MEFFPKKTWTLLIFLTTIKEQLALTPSSLLFSKTSRTLTRSKRHFQIIHPNLLTPEQRCKNRKMEKQRSSYNPGIFLFSFLPSCSPNLFPLSPGPQLDYSLPAVGCGYMTKFWLVECEGKSCVPLCSLPSPSDLPHVILHALSFLATILEIPSWR